MQQFNGLAPGLPIPQDLSWVLRRRHEALEYLDLILALRIRPPVLPQFVTPGPINPPQKSNSNLPPPSMLAPSSGRRQSIADLGPIDPRGPFNLSIVPLNRQGQSPLLLFAGRLAQKFLAFSLLPLKAMNSCQLRVGRWLTTRLRCCSCSSH